MEVNLGRQVKHIELEILSKDLPADTGGGGTGRMLAIRCPSRDANPAPPEYKSEAIPLQLTCSAHTKQSLEGLRPELMMELNSGFRSDQYVQFVAASCSQNRPTVIRWCPLQF
jgi:hypothetical protein